jgi:molybdopterin converting factor small subunit
MKLTVEFLGPSRRLTQVRETSVVVAVDATYRDVLRLIATLYPPLVEAIIVPPTYDLAPAFMLNVDGRRVVNDLDTPAEEGQRLIIMVMEAGG